MAYERAKATTRQRVYGTRSSGLSQLNETLPTLSDYCGQPCPDACVCSHVKSVRLRVFGRL